MPEPVSHLISPIHERRTFMEILDPDIGTDFIISGVGPFLQWAPSSLAKGLTPTHLGTTTFKVFPEAGLVDSNGKYVDGTVKGCRKFPDSKFLLAWSDTQIAVLDPASVFTDEFQKVECVKNIANFPMKKMKIICVNALDEGMIIVLTDRSVDTLRLVYEEGQIKCNFIQAHLLNGHHIKSGFFVGNFLSETSTLFGTDHGEVYVILHGSMEVNRIFELPNAILHDLSMVDDNMIMLYEEKIVLMSLASGEFVSCPNTHKIVKLLYRHESGNTFYGLCKDKKTIYPMCLGENGLSRKGSIISYLLPLNFPFGEISSMAISMFQGENLLVLGGTGGSWIGIECRRDDDMKIVTLMLNTKSKMGLGYVFYCDSTRIVIDTRKSRLFVGAKKPFTYTFIPGITKIWTPHATSKSQLFFAEHQSHTSLVDYSGKQPKVRQLSRIKHPYDWIGFVDSHIAIIHKNTLCLLDRTLECIFEVPLDGINSSLPICIQPLMINNDRIVFVVANNTQLHMVVYVTACQTLSTTSRDVIPPQIAIVLGSLKDTTIIDLITAEFVVTVLLSNGLVLYYRLDLRTCTFNEAHRLLFSSAKYFKHMDGSNGFLVNKEDVYIYKIAKGITETDVIITLLNVKQQMIVLAETLKFGRIMFYARYHVHLKSSEELQIDYLFINRFETQTIRIRKCFPLTPLGAALMSGDINCLVHGHVLSSRLTDFTNLKVATSICKTFVVIASRILQFAHYDENQRSMKIIYELDLPGSTFTCPIISPIQLTKDKKPQSTVSVINSNYGVLTFIVRLWIEDKDKTVWCEVALDDIKGYALKSSANVVIYRPPVFDRRESFVLEVMLKSSRVLMYPFIDDDDEPSFVMGQFSSTYKTAYCTSLIFCGGSKRMYCGFSMESRPDNHLLLYKFGHRPCGHHYVASPFLGMCNELKFYLPERTTKMTMAFGAVSDREGIVSLITLRVDADDVLDEDDIHDERLKAQLGMIKLPFEQVRRKQCLRVVHFSKKNGSTTRIFRYVSGEHCIRYMDISKLLAETDRENVRIRTVEELEEPLLEKKLYTGHSTDREEGLKYDVFESGVFVYEAGVRVILFCDCTSAK